MNPPDLRDLLPLYALNALSPGERQQVEAALEHDPQLRSELLDLQQASAKLVLSLPPEPLPKGLEDRLMGRIRAQSRPSPRWQRWLAPVAAAAAVLLVGWLGGWVWGWGLRLGSPESQLITLVDAQGAVVGRALIGVDRQTLLVLNRPLLVGDKVYQVWGIGEGKPVPLQSFRGQVVLLELPPQANSLAVSKEPPGGSITPTEIVGTAAP